MVRTIKLTSDQKAEGAQFVYLSLWCLLNMMLLGKAISFHWSFGRLLIGVVLTLVLLKVITYKKIRKVILVIEGIGLLMSVLIFYFCKDGITDLLLEIGFSWFFDQWQVVLFHETYRHYVTCLLFLLVCGIGYWGHEKRFRHVLLILEMLLISICQSISQIPFSKMACFCLIAYFLMTLTKGIHHWIYKKEDQKNCRVILFYLLPLYLLISGMSVLLPYDEAPLSWQWAKNISFFSNFFGNASSNQKTGLAQFYEKNLKGFISQWDIGYQAIKDTTVGQDFEEKLTTWCESYGIDEPDFSFTSGKTKVFFEERKYTGQALAYEHKNLLKVSAAETLHSTLYLAGDHKGVYEGSTWKRKDAPYSDRVSEYQYDTFEMLFSLGTFLEDADWDELITANHLQVHYKDIDTKNVLCPSKMLYIRGEERGLYDLKQQQHLSFYERPSEDVTYELAYYELHLPLKAIGALLRGLEGFEYSVDLKDIRSDIVAHGASIPAEFETLTQKDAMLLLKARAEAIKKVYTQLPSNMPKRVKWLAEQITAGCNNDYDRLLAIQKYLTSDPFTYTTEPTRLLEGEDFVDQFLFEQQSGYCCHYASAMAILARCIGIPTRFVEGYVANGEQKKQFEIKDSAAHAWVDAYFEGFGWVTFEATPSSDAEAYAFEDTMESDEEQSLPSGSPALSESLEKETEEASTNQPLPMDIKVESNEQTKEGADANSNTWIHRPVLFMIVFSLGFLSCLLFGFWFYRKEIKKKQVPTLQEHFIKQFNHLYRRIRKQGLGREGQETIQQYKTRITGCLLEEQKPFLELLEHYEAVRYGEEPVSEEVLMKLVALEKVKFSKNQKQNNQ